jgi:hypothetical protein
VRRRLAALGLAVVAAVALSGCMRFSADLTVKEDNTVDGSDQDVAQQIFDDSGLQTSFEREWTHAYSADGYSGVEVEFRDEPLETFAPTSDRFGITREGDEFIVSGKASSMEADDPADAADTPDMTVTIAFPGPVTSANGDISGNTVTWNLVGGPATLEARASAIPAHSPWPSIAVTVAVLAVAALTFWPRAPQPARRQGQSAGQRTAASGRRPPLS